MPALIKDLENEMKRFFNARGLFLTLCIAPSVLLFLIFVGVPTVSVFRLSLFERGAYSPTETFVGLENFKALFSDPRFIKALQNTIALVVAVTVFTVVFALFFAFCLTRERVRFSSIFRTLFYIPNVLSVVVIAGIFSAVYDTDNGLLNSLFSFFSGEQIRLLWKGERYVLLSLVIALVWQAVGYYMVMYMASMSAIPKSVYESADLDGAKRGTQFLQITLPLIWSNLRTTLTFFIISTVNMAFLFVRAMTSGGPNGASEVALSFMYSQKDAGLYGYSMASGVIIFLFTFLLSALVNRASKRQPI